MILETSAAVAICLGEPGAEQLLRAAASASTLSMASVSMVEASIVLESRQGIEAAHDLQSLLADLEVEIVPVDEELCLAAIAGWRRFGKGRHPAALNFGDTFAYALAQLSGQSLLFVGNDFSQTDVRSAR